MDRLEIDAILLKAMYQLQEVRKDGNDPLSETDLSKLRLANRFINEAITGAGATLDDDNPAEVMVTDGEVSISGSVVNALARNREVSLRSQLYENELKENLQTSMEEYGIDVFECDLFKATLIGETTTNRFDSKRFKKEHPEMYEEYVKTGKRGSYVRITYSD